MEYSFNSNEFTIRDLLVYLKRAYGHQVNGNSFSQRSIEDWIRLGKLPTAYGGNKIISTISYPQLSDLRVLTIEHLNREEIENVYGALDKIQSTLQKEKAQLNKKQKKTRRARTELYYKTLGSRHNGKKIKAAAVETLPVNWQEAGIKGNQLNRKK